jgi:hypothetical protein
MTAETLCGMATGRNTRVRISPTPRSRSLNMTASTRATRICRGLTMTPNRAVIFRELRKSGSLKSVRNCSSPTQCVGSTPSGVLCRLSQTARAVGQSRSRTAASTAGRRKVNAIGRSPRRRRGARRPP